MLRVWAHRTVALFSLAYLASSLTGPSGLTASSGVSAQRALFSSRIDVVQIGVSVLDEDGQPVTTLRQSDLEIYEDGERQTIQYFARGVEHETDDLPLHLGVLFDTSDSMSQDARFAKTAAIKFLNTVTYAEDMTLVEFDAQVRVGRYRQDDFPRLVERLRRPGTGGQTVFYDALGVYLDGAFEQEGRKVLLVYSDGEDSRSRTRFSDVVELLRASDVTVYVIGFHKHLRLSSRVVQRARLDTLTQTTGGRAFFPLEVDELDAIYDEIANELENRYTIGYVSTNPRSDGAWRKLEVRLAATGLDRSDTGDLEVRTRDGYYAPFRESDPDVR